MGETSSLRQTSQGQYNFRERGVGVAQQLIERHSGVASDPTRNAQDESQMTPSHLQSTLRSSQSVILLFDSNYGANLNAGNHGGEAALYPKMEGEYFIVV